MANVFNIISNKKIVHESTIHLCDSRNIFNHKEFTHPMQLVASNMSLTTNLALEYDH